MTGNGDHDDEEDDYDDEDSPLGTTIAVTSSSRHHVHLGTDTEVADRFNENALDILFSQLGGRAHAPVATVGSSGNDCHSSSYHHPPPIDEDGLHVQVKDESSTHQDKGLPDTMTSSSSVIMEISPRRLRSRARASTFSSMSKTPRRMDDHHVNDNRGGGSLVMDMIRSPMGHLTWLASLEDDDFVAAKMLTELGSGTGGNVPGIALNSKEITDPSFNHIMNHPPIIPRRRRAQSAIEISSSSSSLLKRLSASSASASTSSSTKRRSKATSR